MVSKKVLTAAISLATVAGAVGGALLSPHVMAAAAAIPAPAAVQTTIGAGAPEVVLLDNDKVKITVVSFPEGFVRTGGMKRKYDEVFVYLDPGDVTVTMPPGGTGAVPGSIDTYDIGLNGKRDDTKPHPVGTIAWRSKGIAYPTVKGNKAYRMMYFEFKKD